MSELDKDIENVRDTFSKFQARRKLQEPAENAKVAVIGLLILSLFLFAAIGDEATKSIIWYWAGLMFSLMIICAIQDIRVAKKIKKDGLEL